MGLAARVYVTTATGEDVVATRLALEDALAERLAAGLLSGYEVGAVSSEQDWEWAALDRDSAEAVTGGRLPFVYANLSYDPDVARHVAADHADVLERFGLRLAWELTPPGG
jgi:hypothetical protein